MGGQMNNSILAGIMLRPGFFLTFFFKKALFTV